MFNNIIDKLHLKSLLYKFKSNIYISNIIWLVIDKILRLSIGIILSVFMARVLGPQEFGKYSYIIAIAFFLGPIANVGFGGLIIKHLTYETISKEKILGTSFVLQLILSLLSILGLSVYYVFFDNKIEVLYAVILSTSFLFQTSNIIKYYFESIVKAKYFIIVENGAFVLTSVFRLCALYFYNTFNIFIFILLLEPIFIFFGLIYVYNNKKKNKICDWKIDLDLTYNLFKKSIPFIISGFSIMVYMKTDLIIINKLLGSASSGLYSVALRLSEVYYTIPLILMSTFSPLLNSSKKDGHHFFLIKLQKLMYLVILISILIITFTMLFSDDLIYFLYGNNYAESSSVLKIHIWTGLFVFIGIISGQWFLLENLQWLVLFKTIFGAILNIILNFLFIPEHGITGAALATLISQFFSVILLDWFFIKSRPIFYFNLKSIFTLPYFIILRLNYAINKKIN